MQESGRLLSLRWLRRGKNLGRASRSCRQAFTGLLPFAPSIPPTHSHLKLVVQMKLALSCSGWCHLNTRYTNRAALEA